MNISFAVTVTRVTYMRTPTNFFLFSLAVSDSLFLTSAIGEKLFRIMSSSIARNEGISSSVGCMIRSLIVDTSYYASLFIITLVTLEKYHAVCQPIKQVTQRGKRRAIRCITLTWILSFLISCTLTPLCMRRMVTCMYWPPYIKYLHLPGYYTTFEPIDAMFYYSSFCQSVPFFVTMIVNAIVYFRLIRALGDQVATTEQRGQDPERTNRIRHLVVRMLIINGAAFFLLLAPFEIIVLSGAIADIRGDGLFDDQADQGRLVYTLVRTLTYVNAVINSAIYWVSNKRYRDAFALTYTRSCSHSGGLRTTSSLGRETSR